MDLSIIIPVYNTPIALLSRCLNALDKYVDFTYEVVLVDDGSTNDIGGFIDEYVKDKKNFTCVHQTNQGVSVARNQGIRRAVGRYLIFVDADDVLHIDVIKKSDLSDDIIYYNSQIIREDGNIISVNYNLFDEKSYLQATCLDRVNQVSSKIYRREMLVSNKIYYNETMRIAEDAMFHATALLKAQNVNHKEKLVYSYYYSKQNGTSRNLKYPETILSNLRQWRDMKQAIAEKGVLGYQLTVSEKDMLKRQIASAYVRDCFNVLCENIIAIGESKSKAEKLVALVGRTMDIQKSDLSFLRKIELGAIQRQSIGKIKIIAHTKNILKKVLWVVRRKNEKSAFK